MSLIFSMLPQGEGVTKLGCQVPNTEAGDFVFARTGTADRTDENGNTVSTPENVPRVDYLNDSLCPELLLDTGESCNNAQANFNDSEGVLQVEIRALSDNGTNRDISINNGSSGNRAAIRIDAQSNVLRSYFLKDGSSNSIGYEVGDSTKSHFLEKIYKDDYSEFKVDGVRVGFLPDRIKPIGLNTCSFGNGNNAELESFKGRCKNINVYDSSTDVKTFATPTEIMNFAGYTIIN